MATKNENKPIGRNMHKSKKAGLGIKGEIVEDKSAKNDGDAEAGLDPQEEHINDTPNDPEVHPREPKHHRDK